MVNDQKSPIMMTNAAKYPKFHVWRQACFGDKTFLDPIKSYPILNRLANFAPPHAIAKYPNRCPNQIPKAASMRAATSSILPEASMRWMRSP